VIGPLAAYARERFPPGVFATAILAMTGVALLIPESAWTLPIAARALGLMALLFLQFRLWDDLEDRDRDAQTHPERVLVRSDARPFWWALVAVTVVNLGLVVQAGPRVAWVGLIALDLVARIAYSWARPNVSERVWTRWMLPVKYSAFVAIVALSTGRPVAWHLLAVGATIAFLGEQQYERSSERKSRLGELR